MHALSGSLAGCFGITLHDRWRLVIRIKDDTIEILEVTNHYGD